MNLELELVRNETFTKDFTAGRILINGELLCYTLEDQVREVESQPVKEWKVYGETAIPRGRYRVLLTRSPRFKRILPELLNVPGFTGIRIHKGNKAAHSHGCILVGMADGNDQDAWLGNSAAAEGVVIARIQEAINSGQQVWLTVR